MLTPWGSDVLRASNNQKQQLKKAFALADYVSSDLSLGFTDKYVQMYNVSRDKLYDTGYGSEVISSVYKQKPCVEKNLIAKEFGIPEDKYYITCGYAANRAQRHQDMIKAVGTNILLFPKFPVLIFPFTYGPDKTEEYQSELVNLCSRYQLNCYFVKEYLDDEIMARLRLLSDLFFHILPTDACSASMIEYILAGSICIVGKWLYYPSLETNQKPYYVCDTLADLPELVGRIYKKNNPSIEISKETINYILSCGWEFRIKKWYQLFHEIIYPIR